jgi:ribosomal protein S18 acetylase RimI-like enzyme
MNAPQAVVRPATPADAAALAELVNMAGEGMPLYLWTGMAGPGQDPWDVGRQRAQRESGSFSFRNATILEVSGNIVGCLIGYELPDTPEPIDYEKMPEMFVPLQELENMACGTWYVNVLATSPRYRGQGFGTKLLGLAEEIAAAARCKGLSIIVSDRNVGARRLYQRCGYRQVATRPMVKEGWQNSGENWVLLVQGHRQRAVHTGNLVTPVSSPS